MNSNPQSPADGRPFISMDGVALRWHDGAQLSGIRWQILSDQHWAVVGPNGAGKSTLMEALCGRVPLVGGRIVYHFLNDGEPRPGIERDEQPGDRIAYVTFEAQRATLGRQSPFHQARWNSGRGQDAPSVSDYLSQREVRKTNPYQAVEEPSDPVAFAAHSAQVIELLGIEALLNRKIVQVSNGERRKVLLARALLRRPRLLILDNPFTGLDERFRARLGAIIESLMQGQMRVILVTAGRDEIPTSITHVLLMENGAVVAQGPREAILNSSAARRIVEPGPAVGFRLCPVEARQIEENERTNGDVLVHMEDVNVSYGGIAVLNQINWTVRRGEHWALLGPNGAGKTTLLSLILGDNPQAYANKITLFGRCRGSGESIWEIKKRIGWVAPELHLYYPRGMPCLDVVCSGLFDSVGLYGRPSPQQCDIALSWMEHLAIGQHAGTAFGAISEGEQRLILIARALVKDPALLILDEPCQGLDAGNRARVLRTVDAIAHHVDGSVVFVTHDRRALPRIITHVIKLNEGSIVNQKGVKPTFPKACKRALLEPSGRSSAIHSAAGRTTDGREWG